MKNLIKKVIFAVFLFGASHSCFAQVRQPTVILGVESGGSFSVIPGRSIGIYDRYWFLRTAPYLEVKVAKNFYAGLNYEFETGKVEGVKTPPLKGFGLHARYFFPLKYATPALKDKFQFYGEVAFLLLDHAVDKNYPLGIEPLSKYSNFNTQLSVGSNFRLFNSLYLNVGLRPMFYTKGKSFQWTNKLGLEYHFGEKREQYVKSPTIPKSKEPILSLSSFLNKITLGSSFTYIFYSNNSGNIFEYKEWTGNLNAAVSITSDIDLGIAFMPIWTKKQGLSVEKHFLTGIFTQYNFLKRFKGNRLFLETGLYRGNLCICGESDPYYRANLTYVPFGGGFEKRLFNSPVYLDLSFLWYNIVSKVPEDKWAYIQYVVGLNYHFYQ